MSEFTTTLIISASIFAVMVGAQFGRREYTWHKVLYPCLGVATFGYFYLKDAPTNASSLIFYAAGIALGLVFAAAATYFTKVEKDPHSGANYTVCGAGFVATWALASLVRVAFVWAVTDVEPFRRAVGTFMVAHQIDEESFAPFFVLMALTMVIGRTVAVKVRMTKLNGAAARVRQQLPVSV